VSAQAGKLATLSGGAIGSVSGWIAARSPRERALLGGLAAAAIVALVLNGVWRPMASARAAALDEIARYETALAEARAAGPRPVPADPRPLASVIADSAPEYGLVIQRLSPEGPRLMLSLESGEFASIIEWLADLQAEQAIGVFAAEVERRPEPGVVSARIVLER
jgi:general secretion pathway protein M